MKDIITKAEIILKKQNNDTKHPVYDEKLYQFCENAQRTLACSAVTFTSLVATVLVISAGGEVNLNNFVSSLTRRAISRNVTLILSPVLEEEPVKGV